MPAPELPPPQSSLPEAASRFGAHVLAEAASRARDISAAAGGLPRPPVLSGAAAPAPAAPPSVIPAPPAGASPPSASVPVPSVPVPGAGTGRVLGGPTGLGTASLRMLRRDAHPAPPVATAEAGAQGVRRAR